MGAGRTGAKLGLQKVLDIDKLMKAKDLHAETDQRGLKRHRPTIPLNLFLHLAAGFIATCKSLQNKDINACDYYANNGKTAECAKILTKIRSKTFIFNKIAQFFSIFSNFLRKFLFFLKFA